MRRVYRAGSLVEAHLVLHQLQRCGIAARVLNQHAQGGLGEIPFSQAYPEVWIEEDEHFVRAREEVSKFEAMPAAGYPRRCRRCGEENPSTFEVCWNCGEAM